MTLDHNELKHYRPVSNLRFKSKVPEKCASSQIIGHTEKHDLSEPMQSAYRRQHSTETALACVHNDISRALDDQKAVLLLMLDLSAAFDTVDHEIMLHRLRNDFGVTATAHRWYSSYFSTDQVEFMYQAHIAILCILISVFLRDRLLGHYALCIILMLLVEFYVTIM